MSEPHNGRDPLSEKTSQTDDERIVDVTPLPPPEHLIRFFPIRGTAVEKLVADTRERIRQIMTGQDDRLLVIMGPCSIHDPAAALEYAARLKALRPQHAVHAAPTQRRALWPPWPGLPRPWPPLCTVIIPLQGLKCRIIGMHREGVGALGQRTGTP
jgi:hypothetical protein